MISHGNGPQVGLLALQASAYTAVEGYPLDVLGAQTEGMIGYVLQQELGNELPFEKRTSRRSSRRSRSIADDPGVRRPDKADRAALRRDDEADALAAEKGWSSSRDGTSIAASSPRRCPSGSSRSSAIKWLLESGCVVICAGGGGIPITYTDEPVPAGRRLVGVEAVIDKDLASALLATDLGADVLAIVTDVDAVYSGWGTPEQRAIRRATPSRFDRGVRRGLDGAEGPRRVPVRRADRRPAAIGSIADTRSARPRRGRDRRRADADELDRADGLGGSRDHGRRRGRAPRAAEPARRAPAGRRPDRADRADDLLFGVSATDGPLQVALLLSAAFASLIAFKNGYTVAAVAEAAVGGRRRRRSGRSSSCSRSAR